MGFNKEESASLKIIADTHTHTLANDHAYSTLTENALAAQRVGLEAICYTEHAPAVLGAPSQVHFFNLNVLPRYIHEVMIVRGAEVNIMDAQGTLDLDDRILERLEWVIASLHPFTYPPETEEAHTKAYLAIAKNPHVDVIGHCGTPMFPFDYERGIKAFKEYDKIVEINSSSFRGKRGSSKGCEEIAQLCAKYRLPIVVSSDSHYCGNIGNFRDGLAMLKAIDFPTELILNGDSQRFFQRIHQINGGPLEGELL